MRFLSLDHLRAHLRWTRSRREADRIIAEIAELFPFTLGKYASTMPGKLVTTAADQALAVAAAR